MELSKDLLEKALESQSKLSTAILKHNICLNKLQDDPTNENLSSQLRQLEMCIVSAGKLQKQVVDRLRKEVARCRHSAAQNGTKFSMPELMHLNNNHMTSNNEAKRLAILGACNLGRGLNGHANSYRLNEDEEIVGNGDVASPLSDNNSVKEQSLSSSEGSSGDDEAIEIQEVDDSPLDALRLENGRHNVEPLECNPFELQKHEKLLPEHEDGEERSRVRENGLPEKGESSPEPRAPSIPVDQSRFLGSLGLYTHARVVEMSRKQSQRAKRSTENENFVYSYEVPTKRKRQEYLQSQASAPQTRQKKARLDQPSPPPTSFKSNGNSSGPPRVGRPKSKSPAESKSPPRSAKLNAKKQFPTSKPRQPLTNGEINGSKTSGSCSSSSSSSSSSGVGGGGSNKQSPEKLGQPSTSWAEHVLSSLPSGLTIERIENDANVCVSCKNVGNLTVCQKCSVKFHITCHTTSPPSSNFCPKCHFELKIHGSSDSDDPKIKIKRDDTAAATYAGRATGKTGVDAELHKATGGLYKADAAEARQFTAAALGINQLPSSTFLIPIAPDAGGSADGSLTVTSLDSSSPTSVTLSATGSSSSRLGFGEQQSSSILLSKLSQPALSTTQDVLPNVAKWQRRWSSDGKSKPEVSVLEWSASRSSPRAEQPDNYVTVEVICNENDEGHSRGSPATDDSSADCLYVADDSPERDELDEEVKQQQQQQPQPLQREPEVLNISSGSSEVQSVAGESEQQLETGISVESSGARAERNNDRDDVLDTLFPGKYGYNIDIVDEQESCSGSGSSNNSMCDEPSSAKRPDNEEQQPEEPREHVKLEEAHLSAPPESELNAAEDAKDLEDSGGGSEQLQLQLQQTLDRVPDNKSDDDVARQNEEDCDGER